MRVVKPKVRGFLCTTSHPIGCYETVKRQVAWVRSAYRDGAVSSKAVGHPKRALVIGSSMGYGLSSRIVLGFGMGVSTVGVCYERPALGRSDGVIGVVSHGVFS